jgi:hypothetical protein
MNSKKNPCPVVAGSGVKERTKGGSCTGSQSLYAHLVKKTPASQTGPEAAAQRRPGPLLASEGTTQLAPFESKRKKMAASMGLNLVKMIETCGLDHVLVLRVTPNSDDYREASKAMNSLLSNFLRKHVEHYFCVAEWGDLNKRLHFHFILVVKWDVGRQAFNFEKRITRGMGYNANSHLLAFWASLRRNLPKYGFYAGHHCNPVRSDAVRAARYVTSYMTKTGLYGRGVSQRGFRLFRVSQSFEQFRNSTHHFSWVLSSPYREKLRRYCLSRGYHDLTEAKKWLGACFQHEQRSVITGVSIEGPDPVSPALPQHLTQRNQLGLLPGELVPERAIPAEVLAVECVPF